MKLSRRLSTRGGIYLPKQHRLQLLWLAGTLLILKPTDDGGLSLHRYCSLLHHNHTGDYIRVTSSGAVTIPKKIRSQLGWKSGISLDLQLSDDGGLFIHPHCIKNKKEDF